MRVRPIASLLLAAALVLAGPVAAGAADDAPSAGAGPGAVAGSSVAVVLAAHDPSGARPAASERAPADDPGPGREPIGDPTPSDGPDQAVSDDDGPGAGTSSPRIDWASLIARSTRTCPEPTVTVADADALHAALADAGPGSVIQLEDGVYRGRFTIDTPADPYRPAWLCGGPGAVLDGGDPTKGYVLHLDDADHWVVQGFGVRNGQKGVMADGVQGVTLRALHVSTIGDEAVHLRRTSTDNLVVDSTITRTGLREPKFGEGVYVGTATSNWCSISDCRPDRSDRNRVVGNWIHGTTAEAVDVKEGTSGGLVEGNRFDGSALTGADSWVDVKGNDWLVRDNHGEHTPLDGFQTHAVAAGWGTDNHFEDNTGLLDDADGFLVALRPVLGNTVGCSNTLTTTTGRMTNVVCR